MAIIGSRDDVQRLEQLREHYQIEKALADQLRHARPEERRKLYSSLYDELYRRVSLAQSHSEDPVQKVSRQMRFVRPYLKPEAVFLEVGAGACEFTVAAARYVRGAYAVEVSAETARNLAAPPANFELLLTDGVTIPLPDGSVEVAYSHQVMEHLHPDDAIEQLREIHRILSPGGAYLCITPHRLSGPHDISAQFSEVASGFHMKEYTATELYALFEQAGFSRVQAYIGIKGDHHALPIASLTVSEEALSLLPHPLRRAVARKLPFRLAMRDIRLVGIK